MSSSDLECETASSAFRADCGVDPGLNAIRPSPEMAPARRCVPSDTSWGNIDRRET